MQRSSLGYLILALGSAAVSIPAGLCDTCVHQQVIRTTRGSSFSLCRRSRTDPAYPRYPRVPVKSCPGYEHSDAASPNEKDRA